MTEPRVLTDRKAFEDKLITILADHFPGYPITFSWENDTRCSAWIVVITPKGRILNTVKAYYTSDVDETLRRRALAHEDELVMLLTFNSCRREKAVPITMTTAKAVQSGTAQKRSN